ncbi:MAG: NAD(P)/FAD-dependent oxidoreductase [Chloroflexales bacterium]|nr:NAD(P)/FAD-dependent oxidoreductase [Chloroflexales bacterium]
MRIVIIGGGPAGIEAARAAAPHADVTLVGDGLPGAWSPLAGRTWLAAAVAGERDLEAISARATRALEGWQARCAADLAALDVDLLPGRGRLDGSSAVLVEAADGSRSRLDADAVIIAAGATLALPSSLAPDGERVLAAEDLAGLRTLPARALVVGDGPIGFELCHTLSLLGTAVTWLVPEESPRSGVASEVDGYLTRLLERQGVRVSSNSRVTRLAARLDGVTAVTANGDRHGADVALLAFGRRPDLDAVGLPADKAAVDVYGQTKLHGVYLVGDALAPVAASVAQAQARAAALHAVRRSSEPADVHDIVLAFMEGPQAAKIGRLTTEGAAGSVTVSLADSLAAHVMDATDGFLTLAWDHGGRVAGAVAVAPRAAEILAPLAVARRAGLRIDELCAIFGPHPSVSELALIAARRA